jgi:hypothetical protein
VEYTILKGSSFKTSRRNEVLEQRGFADTQRTHTPQDWKTTSEQADINGGEIALQWVFAQVSCQSPPDLPNLKIFHFSNVLKFQTTLTS